MAETFKEGLHAAMLRLVQEDVDPNATQVLDWSERTRYGGYCETCQYDYTVVDITYLGAGGVSKVYEYSEDFGTLIGRLARG